MSNLAFDTHKFVKDLTKTGMPDTQAEILANHYASLLNDSLLTHRLATKDDLGILKNDMTVFKDHMVILKGDVAILKKDVASLRDDLRNIEERLSSKFMTTVLSAQIVTIVTICTVTGLLLSLR